MQAAVLYEADQPLAIEELTLLPPKTGEVRVRYAASGVCHSDLHYIKGDRICPMPVVMGHEGAGVVEEVGPGVTYVAPGDHVILSLVPACGRCEDCVAGRPNLCVVRYTLDGNLPDGTTRLRKGAQEIKHFACVSSFAEYGVVPEGSLVKIDADVPLDKGALIGCCVTTGVGAALWTAQVQPGTSVVVIGCGGVGLNIIQGAVLAGAERIIAVDTLPSKLEYAEVFGATHTVNASESDPVEAVRDLTKGRGTDYAFEAIGLTHTSVQALQCTRRGGKAVIVGVIRHGAELTINPDFLHQDRQLLGCTYGSANMRAGMPQLVELYRAKKLKLDELVSRVYRLEGINDAFVALDQGEVARSIISYS
ncbi:NDMA-dependent alcohol dehydrogenase [Candidatus Entotheonellaceae bacterium PAL068K]